MKETEQQSIERCKHLTLKDCPFCGHKPNAPDVVQGEYWGSYNWRIMCSSSHCRAKVTIIADGYFQQLDGALNPHIKPENLYDSRLKNLYRMWNRRATPPPANPEEQVI